MHLPLEFVSRFLRRSVLFAAAFALLGCADETTGPDAAAITVQPIIVTTPWTWSGVAAGGGHTCAIKTDGTVACWGFNYYGQTAVPAGLGTVKQIVAGGDVTCAIRTDDQLVCWGRNDMGQIVNPPTLGSVYQVATSGIHTCAIQIDDTLRCWGWNGYNQIHVLSDLGPAHGVATGGVHTCAIKSDNSTDCWGADINDQASAYGVSSKQLTAGDNHTCTIKTDDLVACWGANHQGQTSVPGGLGAVKQIDAGKYNTCAVKADDTVACWGHNTDGQSSVPGDLGAVKHVSAGDYHTCALKADDTIVCWGWNGSGQRNVPATVTRHAPSATFTAPTTSRAGASFILELSAAGVVIPGDTMSATDAGITYAFDCGTGYGAFSSAATAACTAGAAVTQTVKGKVKDRDGDEAEYSATLDITLAPPTGFAAYVTGTTIHLSWNDNSSTETNFRVRRRARVLQTWGAWEALPRTLANATSYDDSGEAGGTYSYMVRACDADGCAPLWSNLVTTSIAFASPASASASVESTSSIIVTWDNVAGETKFEVFRSHYDGATWSGFAVIGETGTDVTSFTSTALMVGTTYKFRVRACNARGCSAYTATPIVTIPVTPPANVRAGAAANEIVWDDLSANEVRYEVDRRDYVAGTWTAYAPAGSAPPNGTSFIDSGRPAGTFRYRVRACYEMGCSAYVVSTIIVVP